MAEFGFSIKGLKALALLALILALAAIGYAAWAFVSLPKGDIQDARDVPPLEFRSVPKIPPQDWAAFKGATTPSSVSGPQVQYRLAGTFSALGSTSETAAPEYRAIIDDLKSQKQHLLRRGDHLNQFEITTIERNRVVLRAGLDEYELVIGYASGARATTASDSEAESDITLNEEEPVLEVTPYGKRVGEYRWVLDKAKLEGYWDDLMDAPERLAALYLSMKPDYQDDLVTGYTIRPKGEHDFFGQMGLLEGDTIRKVNSMRMVSQKRAEYFIREFTKDRLGAVVLEVDREGEDQKLIYLIR